MKTWRETKILFANDFISIFWKSKRVRWEIVFWTLKSNHLGGNKRRPIYNKSYKVKNCVKLPKEKPQNLTERNTVFLGVRLNILLFRRSHFPCLCPTEGLYWIRWWRLGSGAHYPIPNSCSIKIRTGQLQNCAVPLSLTALLWDLTCSGWIGSHVAAYISPSFLGAGELLYVHSAAGEPWHILVSSYAFPSHQHSCSTGNIQGAFNVDPVSQHSPTPQPAP